MKEKIAALLLIAGGVLASQTYSYIPIPSIVLSLLGGFFLSFSLYNFLGIYGGTLWGQRIKSSPASKRKVFFSAIGLLFGGYCALTTVLVAFSTLFSGKIVELILHLVGFVVPLVIAPFVAKVLDEKAIAKEKTVLMLDSIEMFQQIDSNLGDAVSFVVGFEGVALFSKTDYCYAVYLYEDYQLGSLSTPNEVALVGTYFVQKYHKDFTFKVDTEIIPGEPGQTVVAVGTGGITVGRTSGTKDQRLFRSYIFTRR